MVPAIAAWPWIPGQSGEFRFRNAPGSTSQAAIAGTIHHRARAANDGRGWHDRVVIVPPGLNDRNDYALEAAKRYPNRFGIMAAFGWKTRNRGAAADMEAAAGHARRARDVQHARNARLLSDGTADWFWPAAEKAGLPSCFLRSARFPGSPHRGAPPQLTLIIDHMGLNSSSRANRVPR